MRILLVSILSSIFLCSSAALAQSFTIDTELSRRQLTVIVDDDTVNGCFLEFYASPRRTLVARKSVRIGSAQTTTDAVTLQVAQLPRRIRTKRDRRQTAFFVIVRARCGDSLLEASPARVRVKARNRGPGKKRFLRIIARKALQQEVGIAVYEPNLQFNSPVDIQAAQDGSGRLFVVEQSGRIQVVASNGSRAEYLDLSDRISTGREQGLLGLAFAPDFSSSGRFYVNYTNTDGATVVSRFLVNPPSAIAADPTQETILLTVDQPFANHNAGQLQFGLDGMLYIGLGDGGGAGDPDENGQDPTTLLGSMLRIDVSSGAGYSIPQDNPFVGNTSGIREEIYAIGLRNPFRYSFDSSTGLLWAGDVGQNAFEEINVIRSGGNYGWNTVEGNDCFVSSPCQKRRFEKPIRVYDRTLGQSVTGGYVYRETQAPALFGYYLHADFVSGRLWAISADVSQGFTVQLADTDFFISTFGLTEDGRLLFADYSSGQLYEVQG